MKKILAIAIAGIIIALSTAVLYAQPQKMSVWAQSAIVLCIEGEVSVRPQGAIRWVDATVDMKLKQGDSIRTGAGSWAEIGVVADYENIMRIDEKTVVQLLWLGPAIKLSLVSGEIRSLVEGISSDSTFEIETPLAVCGVRGTGWDTRADDKQVIIDTYEDNVFLSPKTTSKKETVGEGKRGTFKAQSGGVSIQNIPPERIKSWNEWKESLAARGLTQDIEKGVDDRSKNIKDKEKNTENRIKGKLEKRDRDNILRRSTPSVKDHSY